MMGIYILCICLILWRSHTCLHGTVRGDSHMKKAGMRGFRTLVSFCAFPEKCQYLLPSRSLSGLQAKKFRNIFSILVSLHGGQKILSHAQIGLLSDEHSRLFHIEVPPPPPFPPRWRCRMAFVMMRKTAIWPPQIAQVTLKTCSV